MKHNKLKIPTIIGLLVLILGIGAGVFFIQTNQQYKLGANPEQSPKQIKITNITDNSFTVSWVTDKPTLGLVNWGTSPSNTSQVNAPDTTNTKTTHSITVKNLSSTTTYHFTINSAGTKYDNSGIPWQVTTAPTINTATSTHVISGTVTLQDGSPVNQAIVYVTPQGGSTLSTTTSASGSWVIPLGSARDTSLTSYLAISARSPLLEISVHAGPTGLASAQVYPEAANPAPPIIIGQTHDFRSSPANNNFDFPQANLNLPGSNQNSGFDVEDTSSLAPETVSLDSIDENEIISTTTPEFFGDGPPGTQITITIQSDPITATTTVSPDGTWSWSPPQNLPEGEHSITLSWRNSSGILQSITRTFTVLAADEPSFESTPSATTSTPTPTPTPTPIQSGPTTKPTNTPTPTATATPVPTEAESEVGPTPRTTIPSTSSPVPTAGSLTPTIMLLMMGIGMLFGSTILYKTMDKK